MKSSSLTRMPITFSPLSAFCFLLCNPFIGFCQLSGTQSQPNKMLPDSVFFSLVEDILEGESTLHKYDFTYIGPIISEDGKTKYGTYRLDHSLSEAVYQFDLYHITNQIKRFEYITSSSKNYEYYKTLVLKNKIRRLEGELDYYYVMYDNIKYLIKLDRSITSKEIPNYKITVSIL